ncbi:hypothetical protein [Arcicella rosea]|uniref:Putative radical SAM superfamily protein n=1 Tax=Arcicella rosea TaxID=502909 RepID=A0A841EW08_9BACT|nr:hypothetical protein [Arcicella rosea]MBB6005599.1 putative radical SAM superfamily protein [Arcicella rosea]
MSNLFLYIQVRNHRNNITYNNESIDFVKKTKPSVIVYDIDNHSDNLTFHYANKLIKESEKVFVLLDVEEDSSLKQLMALLNNLLDKSDSLKLAIKGNNKQLEKVISILDYQKIKENTHEIDILETILREFL